MHSHIHCSSEADAYEHITTESNETFLLRGTQAVRAALSSGVTTMRDLGSRNEVVFPLRQGISDGIIPGPRLLVAGTPITTTGGHCNMFGTEANTSAEVVKAIRQQFKLGADCIKIMGIHCHALTRFHGNRLQNFIDFACRCFFSAQTDANQ